ncbi:MAG: ribonuclease III [Succinivibrio sp.]|nr:ribonuclease III [Succinivibrio sp.]
MSEADRVNVLALQQIETKIGYAFQDINLLNQALTHRSFGPNHNERLEYIGDAILGVIIAKQLFDQFKDCPEGDLTRMRSTLVRETTLAEIARDFHLGENLRLGPGERKTGGDRKQSMIADAVESVIGAMFVDSHENYPLVRKVVLSWFEDRLEHIKPGDGQKDHKSVLQELLQSQHLPLPDYEVIKITGAENAQQFTVEVRINNVPNFQGKGTSKRKAEQEAAGKALEYLQQKAAAHKH